MSVVASQILITYQIRTRAYEEGIAHYPHEIYLAAKRLVSELEALAPTEAIAFEEDGEFLFFRVEQTGRELARMRKAAWAEGTQSDPEKSG